MQRSIAKGVPCTIARGSGRILSILGRAPTLRRRGKIQTESSYWPSGLSITAPNAALAPASSAPDSVRTRRRWTTAAAMTKHACMDEEAFEPQNRAQLWIREGAEEFLRIRPLQVHEERSDFTDGEAFEANWLRCAVTVACSSFSARIETDMRREEFSLFYEGLRALHRDLRGVALFRTIEDGVEIDVRGDGRGHFEAHGLVRDTRIPHTELRFCIAFDQTWLAPILVDLARFVAEYPVIRATKR